MLRCRLTDRRETGTLDKDAFLPPLPSVHTRYRRMMPQEDLAMLFMFILLIGMLPAFLLIRYLYRLDSIEKEPVGLLLHLFILGGIMTVVASGMEMAGLRAERLFLRDTSSLAFKVIENFVVIGVSEELVKYIALRRTTWYNINFNYRFDGVVYSATTALGFAAVENVLYILRFGIGVAPVRALTSIPLHCITGIFMGHYYGQAKYCESRHLWDAMTFYNILSIAIPALLHGFYDFAAGAQSELLSFIFLGYVIVLDIIAYICVRRFAKDDVNVEDYSGMFNR